MKRNMLNETLEIETGNTVESLETPSNVLDFSTTLSELRKKVDPTLIRHRSAGRDRNGQTHMVEYVEWHTVADILDEHAPNWVHSVKDIRSIGEIVTVTVAITIDGITREGIGTGKAISEMGIKKAEHDALKRAAVKFGIARELYKKEFDLVEHVDVPQVSEPRSFVDAVARSLGDMVTAKQLGMIRVIARESGIDAEYECSQLLKCRVEELSKRAASDLIEHLQDLQRNSGAAAPMRRVG